MHGLVITFTQNSGMQLLIHATILPELLLKLRHVLTICIPIFFVNFCYLVKGVWSIKICRQRINAWHPILTAFFLISQHYLVWHQSETATLHRFHIYHSREYASISRMSCVIKSTQTQGGPFTNMAWDEITYPFPNFNGATVKVWEWISYFIPHSIMDVIIYPCWD